MKHFILTLAASARMLDEAQAKALLVKGYKMCEAAGWPACSHGHALVVDGTGPDEITFARSPMNLDMTEWYCRIRWRDEWLAAAVMDGSDV